MRHIWKTWQHKGRATTQTRLRGVSSCWALSRWNSSNNFLISEWYNSNWSVLVSCRMSRYLETQSGVWGGLWAPDSAQFAAERSWNWYQVEETHLQISLHLPDLPVLWRLAPVWVIPPFTSTLQIVVLHSSFLLLFLMVYLVMTAPLTLSHCYFLQCMV